METCTVRFTLFYKISGKKAQGNLRILHLQAFLLKMTHCARANTGLDLQGTFSTSGQKFSWLPAGVSTARAAKNVDGEEK